jgi:hypothetical protein
MSVLGASQQRRVRTTLKNLASGHAPVNPPRPAGLGMRWSDVPLSVIYACDDAQMAVVRHISDDRRFSAELITIEDFPAHLSIDRLQDEQGYRASATVGRFGDRTDRAGELLRALQKYMRAFAAKRGFEQ